MNEDQTDEVLLVQDEALQSSTCGDCATCTGEYHSTDEGVEQAHGSPVLTICEWELAIAAWAYEMTGRVTMSDNTYDALAKSLGERGSNIPGFADMTGQWVHNLDMDMLEKLCKYAWSINRGYDDLHQPAVKESLDKYSQKYKCCIKSFNCWEQYNYEEELEDES
jgi:hypothetical protein